MKRKRFTEERINGVLKEYAAGAPMPYVQTVIARTAQSGHPPA
ncbi:MAG: hypothetical protein ACRESI_00880 [Gammaproteobacteria bacterium]